MTSPESQGMDSQALADAVDAFKDRNVISFTVIRNGCLVMEAYNGSVAADKLQDVRSITKAVMSALTGIAVAERKLQGIDQKVSEFFPEFAQDPLKSEMRIRHLLSMTSGLEWNNENEKSSIDMMHSSDWIQEILMQPAKTKPGTKFSYSNGDAHLLSAILQKATGESMFDYAKTRLFAPLGISNADWGYDPQGYSIGAWAMGLTLRDMAKLGWLFLKNGLWEGRSVIPKQWIAETLVNRVWLTYPDGRRGGYGYFWWTKPLAMGIRQGDTRQHETFYAAGAAGQRIFAVPELQLVVAMTANSPDVDMPEQLLNHAVRAIRSDMPLPADFGGMQQLNRAIESMKLS
jgi:CubicO group peptidase (beta-lactamase class C family)